MAFRENDKHPGLLEPETRVKFDDVRDLLLELYVRTQKEWSEKTFGSGTRRKGIIEHIRKELEEIEESPDDLMEWIDVIILALDGLWRAGAEPHEVFALLVKKQKINMAREYPFPKSQDEPTFHKKEKDRTKFQERVFKEEEWSGYR